MSTTCTCQSTEPERITFWDSLTPEQRKQFFDHVATRDFPRRQVHVIDIFGLVPYLVRLIEENRNAFPCDAWHYNNLFKYNEEHDERMNAIDPDYSDIALDELIHAIEHGDPENYFDVAFTPGHWILELVRYVPDSGLPGGPTEHVFYNSQDYRQPAPIQVCDCYNQLEYCDECKNNMEE